MATTQFELVTPTRTLYSGGAEMVVCKVVSGEIAFLADHMPYIGALESGVVRIVGPVAADGSETGADNEIRVAVHGGFVEVKDNQVIMLADVAEMAAEIDVARARQAEQTATDTLASSPDDKDAEAARARAQTRLQAVEPSH